MPLIHAGITGFDAKGAVAMRDFKRAVYAAAGPERAEVGQLALGDGATPSFYQLDVDFGSQKLSVLCNRYAPIVAFAEPIDGSQIKRFLPAPAQFAAALSELHFVVADAAELNRRLEAADLALLSSAERQQAKYWKPKRVGDIIFNWWD